VAVDLLKEEDVIVKIVLLQGLEKDPEILIEAQEDQVKEIKKDLVIE
jgi:hypothetical protein